MKVHDQVSITVIAIALFTSATRAAVRYSFTDLGSQNDADSYAVSINNAGQVAGYSNGNAVIYSGGAIVTVPGLLGGNASCINDNGQVVGMGGFGSPVAQSHAFLYSANTTTDLGTLGGNSSLAFSINKSGQIVGHSEITGDSAVHAFRYSAGTMTDLGTLGGTSSQAFAINDTGLIVGDSETTDDLSEHAVLFSNGMAKDLGSLGGGNYPSQAMGINNLGAIVGNSSIAGNAATHAFLYEDGNMTDLGTLGGQQSSAVGINDSGQIIGQSITSTNAYHPFIYSNGMMTDLNDLISPAYGWTLYEAFGINDAGQIVGNGFNSAGRIRAFLLTPVPDPAALPLLLFPATLLLRRQRHAS